MSARDKLTNIIELCVVALLYMIAMQFAYEIRLYAITTYGRVIHEFDPWFNMRATDYLANNGLERFFKWYDYESWYPLGRPVGTTIYPGMQITSVFIWNTLKNPIWQSLGFGDLEMSLNDVCVFVPAWFGIITTFFVGLLAQEVTGSRRVGAFAALIMSVIPSHLMRSVGGGYDNESVALPALSLSFYFWVRALRTPGSWPFAFPAALSMGYMMISWGGYIFATNMIGLHVGGLVLLQRYTPSLHAVYSIWYIISTSIAVQVPVIGWAPFQSMDVLGTLVIFLGLQFIYVCEFFGKKNKWSWATHYDEMKNLYVRAVTIAGCIGIALLAVLIPSGFFGPLSIRVRSLFIPHTRTGNPLVDSVAEHQPVSPEAYWQYLLHTYYLVPIGLIITLVTIFQTYVDTIKVAKNKLATNEDKAELTQRNKYIVGRWFIVLYCVVAFYFSSKMNRLLLLLSPVSSVLAGIVLSEGLTWAYTQISNGHNLLSDLNDDVAAPAKETQEKSTPATKSLVTTTKSLATTTKSPATAVKSPAKEQKKDRANVKSPLDTFFGNIQENYYEQYNSPPGKVFRLVLAVMLVYTILMQSRYFYNICHQHADQISQPSIMFKAKLRGGETVMINDYQETYWWIRDNTPRDARVLSWWDYGYQINGIANRTSLADGNTWNLEHIALLGRILTANETKAHNLARHLADYVLIWAGNDHGDDLAKSPHMARIASSVYSDVCPKTDPLCQTFRHYPDGTATPSMTASMLYKMHQHERKPGVSVNPKLFKEAYTSTHGLVRVFQILNVDNESKAWLADPANRVCDAPGSWYCVGRYPVGFERPPSSHRHLDYDNPNKYVEDQ